MVKGYKTINIKEELIEKIRNLDENKKEVEEGRFNLAGFFVNAALEHISNKETARTKEPIRERLTAEQVRYLLSGELRAFFGEKNIGNVTTTDVNAGLTKEDLKNALSGLESDLDMKMREMLKEVTEKM